jgi:hypothetical protein
LKKIIGEIFLLKILNGRGITVETGLLNTINKSWHTFQGKKCVENQIISFLCVLCIYTENNQKSNAY